VPNTSTTTTTSATGSPDLVPSVSVSVSHAGVHGSTLRLPLRCEDTTCRGTATLSIKGTVLARTRYSASRGSTVLAKITLNRIGRDDLSIAKFHRLIVLGTFTVVHGIRVRRNIELVLTNAVRKSPGLAADAGRESRRTLYVGKSMRRSPAFQVKPHSIKGHATVALDATASSTTR
jgi:hypothetical protein